MARSVHIADRDTAPIHGTTTGQAAHARSDQGSSGSDTGADSSANPASNAGDPLGLDALSSARRMELELAARRAGDKDEALERVIAILLPGNPTRHEAVVRAFRENEKLRAQWANAYTMLTS